jgi:hypothetical protein
MLRRSSDAVATSREGPGGQDQAREASTAGLLVDPLVRIPVLGLVCGIGAAELLLGFGENAHVVIARVVIPIARIVTKIDSSVCR